MNHIGKAARLAHLLALISTDKLQEWIDSGGLSPTESKYIRTAVTYIGKANDSVIGRRGQEYAKRLLRDLKTNELVLEPKLSVRQADTVHITIEDLQELIDQALVVCQDGEYCREDYKSCKVYQLMREMDVPPASEGGGCPYRL